MITVPNKFHFLLNPHTGSRACVEGFKLAGVDVPKIRVHHTPPEEIPDDGLPKYAILRDTIDWAYAFYWNYYPKPFTDWIKKPLPTVQWAKHQLNAYRGYVDKYFIYERGLKDIFKELGFPDIEFPIIGSHSIIKAKYRRKHSEIPLILDRFKEDHEEYMTWLI